ncbi:hypothetical protein ACSQ67_006810 [Phaseolus vulgaris]
MEVSVAASPRKSMAEKVFGGYYGGSTAQKKRGSDARGDDTDGGMELMEIGAERTKNVLILMSDTGGGHRASAEAIRDAFQIEFGDEYRIFVKDVWKEYTGWPLNDMEGQYKFMVKHVQLWNVAFHSTSPRWIHSVYLAAIAAYYAREVEAGLMEYKPDIIISVHPLMQHIPLWVLKWQGLQNKVVFVTVITDLSTCHPTWFHPWVNRCYCPSQEVAKKASQDGLEESQIRVFGLPIRPSFARAVLVKDQLREELGLDPNLQAVLLMGGGEGMGPVKKTAKALGESLYDKEAEKPIGQLVIICGRNKNLVSTLESLEWKIPVKVRGFETQMAKWMGACDCIITKASYQCALHVLLHILLACRLIGSLKFSGWTGYNCRSIDQRASHNSQRLYPRTGEWLNCHSEKGNVPYVVDNGAGVFTRSPKETAKMVAEWFTTKSDELKAMSEKALKLAQPEAVFDIVRDINELAQQREPANFPYLLTSSFTSLI